MMRPNIHGRAVPWARAASALCSAALLACTPASDHRANQEYVTTTLSTVDSGFSVRMADSLDPVVFDTLALAARDPKELIRTFLARLETDDSPELHALPFADDSLLALLPEARDTRVTEAAFMRGALPAGAQTAMIRSTVPRVPRPDLTKFFQAPLPTSPAVTKIIESKRGRANERGQSAYFIAEVSCTAGVAKIRYSSNIETFFGPIGFAFFRAHELAHLRLGHFPECRAPGTAAPTSATQMELDADCEAARILVRLAGQGGTQSVYVMTGQFAHMPAPTPGSTHPSWPARIDMLYRPECG